MHVGDWYVFILFLLTIDHHVADLIATPWCTMAPDICSSLLALTLAFLTDSLMLEEAIAPAPSSSCLILIVRSHYVILHLSVHMAERMRNRLNVFSG